MNIVLLLVLDLYKLNCGVLCIEAFNIVNSLRRLLFVCILRWGAEIAPSIRILSSPEKAASILPGSNSILSFFNPLVPWVNLENVTASGGDI